MNHSFIPCDKTVLQELEKFKWVLDWKIKDLIHSIGPSQIEAAEVKGRMESMEDELLRYVIDPPLRCLAPICDTITNSNFTAHYILIA